jgi:hypothetical protein
MTPGRTVYWCAVAVVVVPALALTGVRLPEPDHAGAPQLGAFTPFGLPLYAAALDGGFPVLSALPPTVGIDHVLVSAEWTVTATGTLDIDGADHRAVVVSVAARAHR